MNVGNFRSSFSFFFLLLFCFSTQWAFGADLPAGRVVWWGENNFWKKTLSTNTNGLVENGNEFLDDAVAVTAIAGVGLALRSDSTVFAFGLGWPGTTDVPAGLSNVVSISSAGGSFWAIKRDGTVSNWGSWEKNDQNQANVIAGLTNVTAIAWSGYKNYLALKNDGTVLGFSLDTDKPPDGLPAIRTVKVQGLVLSDVVALAPMDYTPLVLKKDGTVFSLGYQTPGDTNTSHPLFQYTVVSNTLFGHVRGGIMQLYTSVDPVIIDGQALSNVVAIASGAEHCLALKMDGTVVSWGAKPEVPAGISNVVAITPNLALKRDGTMVAWGGDNHYGENSVPAGLSNIVAIATGGNFNLAVMTGSIPSSVFVQPHGRLEEMEQKADLIFKGQAVSSAVITNAAFTVRAEVRATQFKVISVLQGTVQTNLVTFQHYASSFRGGWSGPRPPNTTDLKSANHT